MGSGCDAVLVQSLLWHASTLNHFQEVKKPPTHIGQSNKKKWGKKQCGGFSDLPLSAPQLRHKTQARYFCPPSSLQHELLQSVFLHFIVDIE